MLSVRYTRWATKFPAHRDLAGFDFEPSKLDRALGYQSPNFEPPKLDRAFGYQSPNEFEAQLALKAAWIWPLRSGSRGSLQAVVKIRPASTDESPAPLRRSWVLSNLP